MRIQEKGLKSIFQGLISLKDFIMARRKKDNCGGSDGSIIRI